MQTQPWIDILPLPGVFLVTLLYTLSAIGAGMWLGSRQPTQGGGEIGAAVGATLGLLAFLLAFTFNMAANRFDSRKQLLMDEVNAIETAHLRAELLPAPDANDARRLLEDYVVVRASVGRGEEPVLDGIRKSEAIQDSLWSIVRDMESDGAVTIAESLFIQSLNEVLDLHQNRVIVGLYYRIPGTIWGGLYSVAGLAMIVLGYQFGRPDSRRMIVVLVLAMTFSGVMLMIADLDRASGGWTSVNHQPLYDLEARYIDRR